MRNFIGRGHDLKTLQSLWQGSKTQILCIYGRRRVGKSELIRVFAKNKPHFLFEAIEGEDTTAQIQHFLNQLARLCEEPHLADLNYSDWAPVFDLVTQKINGKKELLLSFDELPWMAAGRSKLVSLIKYYWDQHWKYHPHLVLILCGSVASWMVKNVVQSKALYGRVSQNLLLDPLAPHEVAEYIGKKRGADEILQYLLCFGGIPRYLEEFNFNHSFEINVAKTCFQKSGFFVEEAEKIFYNQFKETQTYKKIVYALLKKSMNLQEIADMLKMSSSGGVKTYLDNLVSARMIDSLPSLNDFKPGKHLRFYVCDEFLQFHKYFIAPNLMEIKSSDIHHNRFAKYTRGKWESCMGLMFERFCLRHRYRIAALLGFLDKVTACAPICNNKKLGYQYDLVFVRSDSVITLCEVKYLNHPVSTEVIAEFEKKISNTDLPRGATIEKILICNESPSPELKASGYFHHILIPHDLVADTHGL